MINVILIAIGIFTLAKLMNSLNANAKANEPIRSTCPPHSWSWQKMYNSDGSETHERVVCLRCGPINGSQDE